MGGGKRQAFSRGSIFGEYFEWRLGATLERNSFGTAWEAVREATLSKCITAPLARMSLYAIRWTMYAQRETFGRGGEPQQKHRRTIFQFLLNIAHSALLSTTQKEYRNYNAANYDEWNQSQHNTAGEECCRWCSRC